LTSKALILIAFAAAIGAAFLLWSLAVALYYRLRGERPMLLRVRCADGWSLAVHYRPAPVRKYEEPVVLCHGLAANHLNFDFQPPHSVAHFLAEAGFDCFSVDWRGSGASRKRPAGWRRGSLCADDLIAFDAPALVKLALERTGARKAFWVGHSLGGLIGLAAAESTLREQLKGLVAIGSSAIFPANRAIRRALRWGAAFAWPFELRQRLFSAGVAPFLGYAVLPFSDLIINPRHISPRLQRQLYALLISSVSRKMLLQLQDWAFNDAFRSFDWKIDYRERLARLTVPLLAIAGSADRLSPVEGIQAGYALTGSPDKTLRVVGRAHGHVQDYGHGDLIFGENAPSEVYPIVGDWLKTRATAIEPEKGYQPFTQRS
jgi:pimeloyl-ACP methyl ester carboxylesterase